MYTFFYLHKLFKMFLPVIKICKYHNICTILNESHNFLLLICFQCLAVADLSSLLIFEQAVHNFYLEKNVN